MFESLANSEGYNTIPDSYTLLCVVSAYKSCSYVKLFTTHYQVYTYLDHLNVTLSYNAMLKLVSEVSRNNEVPLQKWIAESSPPNMKFIGDNVSKKVEVRDIRSDHQSHLKRILIVRGHIPNSPASDQPLKSPPLTFFLVVLSFPVKMALQPSGRMSLYL